MKTNFNLSIFEKIEDIIYFDEPILSHLKLNDRDYLLYLVDNTNVSEIFLLFQIDEDCILEYLTKNKSLREIIIENSFVNIIEQNFSGEIIDSSISMPVSLPEDYLPLKNSFLEYNPTESSYYHEKIKEYERKSYLNDLRKDAFYLKFSTNNKKFGDTIGFSELSTKMMKNVTLSYKNFIEIDFDKKFTKIIPLDSKRNSVFKQVYTDADLRMVDLKYGSFEIGLATDKLMKKNIEFPEVKEWADNVGNSFKDIVLDDNIEDDELNKILENYTEEERNKIFAPIVKIVDNPDYNLQIRNRKEKTYQNLGIKKKNISSKIITKNKIVEEDNIQSNLEILNVTTIIDRNSNKKSFNLDNTLFNTVQEVVHTLNYADFIKFGIKNTELEGKINLHIENVNNNIVLTANFGGNDFQVVVINDKIDDGIKKMIENISEYILNK